MQVAQLLSKMDALLSKGEILEAVNQFFADNAYSKDFDGSITTTKAQMVEKMTGFTGGIKTVNSITLHHAVAGADVSMSEYTFDFDMKDGSHILWHEIIRREWKDDKVVNEQYFQN